MNKWTVLVLLTLCSPTLWAAEYQATLQWSHRVELSTPVSGTVNAVNVDMGDNVTRGQALLSLDSTMFTATVEQGRAETTRLKAETEEDKRDLNRVRELHERTVASTAELDQAELTEIKSSTMLAEAQARLTKSQKSLDDTILRAPFDGIVIARQVEPGQTVAAQLQPKTLLVLAKSGEMIARIPVAISDLDKFKIGQVVKVTVSKVQYGGKVKTLGLEPLASKDGPVYLADVLFSTKDSLRAGSSAMVTVP
ncbi:MAG: efflux RND transporter periplasmic adaptor subunit [Gallionella sp.]